MIENKTKYLFEIWEFKELAEWQTINVQIMKTGEWKHPVYWKFKVTDETINDVIKNFEENVSPFECLFSLFRS